MTYRRHIHGLNTCRHLERNAEQWQKHSPTHGFCQIPYLPEFSCLRVFVFQLHYIEIYLFTHTLQIWKSNVILVSFRFWTPTTSVYYPTESLPRKPKECGGFGEFDLLYTDESLKPFESHFSKPTVPLAKVDGGLFKTMWFGWGPFRESGMELGMYTVYSLFWVKLGTTKNVNIRKWSHIIDFYIYIYLLRLYIV